MKEKKSEINHPEIMPDMKLYFGEMFKILVLHSHSLSLAGMNHGRSGIDMARELLLTAIEKIGDLNYDDFEDVWQNKKLEFYEETRIGVESGKIIPKSRLPKEYKKLFQDIRVLYFFAEEKVKEKGEHAFSYEGTVIGIPVELVSKMLDKIVDTDSAKAKWEEVRGGIRKKYQAFLRKQNGPLMI